MILIDVNNGDDDSCPSFGIEGDRIVDELAAADNNNELPAPDTNHGASDSSIY
jgi:hypothetical protein